MTKAPEGITKVEISRSYGRKVKTDVQYEMKDIFASRKAECNLEDVDKVSKWLFECCVEEVEAEVEAMNKKPVAEHDCHHDPDDGCVCELEDAPTIEDVIKKL